MRPRSRPLSALLLLPLFAGCGGGDGTGPGGGNVVEIHLTASSRFSPDNVTIAPGTTVRWINDADILHTVTPSNPQQPGVWARAERATRGVVLEHRFTVAGQTYHYFCEPHLTAGMTGTIRVQ